MRAANLALTVICVPIAIVCGFTVWLAYTINRLLEDN